MATLPDRSLFICVLCVSSWLIGETETLGTESQLDPYTPASFPGSIACIGRGSYVLDGKTEVLKDRDLLSRGPPWFLVQKQLAYFGPYVIRSVDGSLVDCPQVVPRPVKHRFSTVNKEAAPGDHVGI